MNITEWTWLKILNELSCIRLKAMALWRHMTQAICRSGLECLEGVIFCEMPCLHLWFAQTGVKQNKGWGIWYYILSSSIKRIMNVVWGRRFLHLMVLQLVLDKPLTHLVSTYVSANTWQPLTHSVSAWVSADIWQVLDMFCVCLCASCPSH